MFLQNLRLWMGNCINGLKKVRPCTLPQCQLSKAKNILLLSAVADTAEAQRIAKFKAELKTMCPSATVSQITFYDPKLCATDTFISNNGIEYITANDFSFFFKIKNIALLEMLSREYDMSVLVLPVGNTYLQFLQPYVRANIKAGKCGINNELNFMVDIKDSDTDSLCQAIISTLKMIFINN